MRTDDFDFQLPPELIAQAPALQRDQSRLLVLRRDSGEVTHRRFADLLEYLQPGDVLVLNNSRVIPARLRGVNAASGGQFEILLLEENAVNDWWAMLRPGKRARVGTQIILLDAHGNRSAIPATVLETNEEGHRRVRFDGTPNIFEQLDALGEVPLPPYIRREARPSENRHSEMDDDRERYQTVFAKTAGSVAAPTAGLHFTETFLEKISSRGVRVCFVTLHVGLGTFAPVKSEMLSAHKMHEERYELSESTARTVNEARAAGRRIVAVGTTSVRVLESAAGGNFVTPGAGRTRIFIYPPRDFKIVNALLTNFHLPRSTLLMLVSAFAAPNRMQGREMILSAYAEAIRERYRFFSYGDAMLLV
jgi:S-adenosylmethionine:tRNA ribosyltransferase-isomerase